MLSPAEIKKYFNAYPNHPPYEARMEELRTFWITVGQTTRNYLRQEFADAISDYTNILHEAKFDWQITEMRCYIVYFQMLVDVLDAIQSTESGKTNVS